MLLQNELQSAALVDLWWAKLSAVHVSHGANIPGGEIKCSFLICWSPASSFWSCFFDAKPELEK